MRPSCLQYGNVCQQTTTTTTEERGRIRRSGCWCRGLFQELDETIAPALQMKTMNAWDYVGVTAIAGRLFAVNAVLVRDAANTISVVVLTSSLFLPCANWYEM